ncbi:MAG: hypothetical protein ACLQBY_07865 [Solirubrobacteraceae bacterium]
MTEIFDGYWLGYQDPPGQTLDQTPAYVDHVTLFVAGPDESSRLDTSYLCSKYKAPQIIDWVRGLQAQGQKVLLSILDTPTVHWNKVDIPTFAASVREVALGEWGLDGIDVDAESEMPEAEFVSSFVELVDEIAAVLQSGQLLAYTCYQGCYPESQDNQILSKVQQHLNWVNLMAYWDEPPAAVALFEQYASVVGERRVAFGVKPGHEGEDQSTLLATVEALAKWEPTGEPKAGMMLFGLNRDNPTFTQLPEWTFAEAIERNRP